MKRVVLVLGLFAASLACAQDTIKVPFSDPSRPKTVKVHSVSGGISVTGYSGNEVVIETRNRSSRDNRRSDGLRRIDMAGGGLIAEEQENVILIKPSAAHGSSHLVLQVPINVNLELRTVNDGDIVVENITGDLDVQNTNGSVKLTNVSGSVLAHALNGNVVVTLNQAKPDKPMSFTSLNGNLDVTLPPDIKARFRLKNDNGDVYSDFDMLVEPSRTVVENGKPGKGKYTIKVDRAMTGIVNGGGPDFTFQTLNGRITIRKKR